MDHILVFVNFTEASAQALTQAAAYAALRNASLAICHVAEDFDEVKHEKLKAYAALVEARGAEATIVAEHGEFFERAAAVTARLAPDLVLIGTIGAEGFSLSHFGSAIYKLVRMLPAPSLVLASDATIAEEGYAGVMLPLSAHPDFLKLVKQIPKVLSANGEVTILSVVVNGKAPETATAANGEAAKTAMDELGIQWNSLEVAVARQPSGYSGIVLEEMQKEGISCLAIPADLSKNEQHFGKMDKEMLLSNTQGFSVLCVNTDFD